MSWDDDQYDPDDFFADEPEGLYVKGHQKIDGNGQPVATDKAVLWVVLDGRENWIPHSQILSMDEDTIQITEWLADKRGWTENINRPPEPAKEWDMDDDIPF